MILRLVLAPVWLEHHITIIPRLLPIVIPTIIPHQTHILLILLLIPRQPPLTRHLPPLRHLHRLIIITITNRSCWFGEKVFY